MGLSRVIGSIALAITFALSGIAALATDYHNANEAFQIPREEIPKLEAQALQGSGYAAYRLSQFYGFLVLDDQLHRYWMNIAAQNENPTAQYGLGLELSESHDQRERLRACYWLKKSKDKGSSQINLLANSILVRLGATCDAHTTAP